MRLCRYSGDRLGLVEGETVRDVSPALEALPAVRWPAPRGDALIANLDSLRLHIERAAATAAPVALDSLTLNAPVANPDKIFGAPLNYAEHVTEANRDPALHLGREIPTIEKLGLFLKANSSLVGPGDGIAASYGDRRVDHEIELVAVIGRKGRRIAAADALDYIAGYATGLDISVRGTEERTFRKSADTFSVLGPFFVTADEVSDPNQLDLVLDVNGERRQASNTRYLIYNVQKLVELASSFCTLYPGDLIYTGTPEGVGPIVPGDVLRGGVEKLGTLTVTVRA